MKMMRTMTIAAVICACLGVFLGQATAADTSTWDKIIKTGKITVGNSPDYPPFETLDDNGKRVGFDIDLLNAMCAQLGIEAEFVTMDFGAIVTATQSGQVNIGMSGFSITEERRKMVNFSNPYYISGQAVVTAPKTGIKSVDDLKGKRVAVGLGTTGQEEAEKIEGITIQYPEDYTVAFVMLKNGGSDAVICDLPVAEAYLKQGGFELVGKPLSYEEFAIIANKKDGEVVKNLNDALAKVKTDGTYDKLIKKWELK